MIQNINAKIIAALPDMPSGEVLQALAYLPNASDDWEYSDDEHAEVRSEIVLLLYKSYSKKHHKIVRYLLQQEILRAKHHSIMTDTLRMLCFMLYNLGDVADCELFYRAKFETCFDAGLSLEVDFIFGLNPLETEKYYSNADHKHEALLEILKTHLPSKNFAQSMREYFKKYE